MATKSIVHSKSGPVPVGPYSPAVRVGDLLFCSGQIPLDPVSGQMVTGDIAAQTERVMENIRLLLEGENLSLAHVVKSSVFLVDLNDFAAMNQVYGRRFGEGFPARSTVQVAALPRGARVEIEVIAHY